MRTIFRAADTKTWHMLYFVISMDLGIRLLRLGCGMLFKHIECFLTVAKLGSITRASAEMFLTQPTLTARLKALEEELGDQLFVRSKAGMRLTEAGQEFIPYAERCVESIESGQQRLKELRSGTSGQLKIAALPRVSTYTLPTLLGKYTAEYPNVLVSVRTGHATDILEMVLREEVQLGLGRHLDHPEIDNIPLYDEDLVLVVEPQHRFALEDSVSITEVAKENLILFDRASAAYELTKLIFRNSGLQEPKTMELDNIEAAKRMVEHRLGVSFLPKRAITRAVSAGRIVQVPVDNLPQEGQEAHRSIVALHRKDVPLTGATLKFLDMALEVSGDLGES